MFARFDSARSADYAPASTSGSDTIECTDTDGADAGASNDSIRVVPSAVVGDEPTDEVNGNDGNDTIADEDTVNGNVSGGAGDDSLMNSSGDINANADSSESVVTV